MTTLSATEHECFAHAHYRLWALSLQKPQVQQAILWATDLGERLRFYDLGENRLCWKFNSGQKAQLNHDDLEWMKLFSALHSIFGEKHERIQGNRKLNVPEGANFSNFAVLDDWQEEFVDSVPQEV